jgi:hypothetical protein
MLHDWRASMRILRLETSKEPGKNEGALSEGTANSLSLRG